MSSELSPTAQIEAHAALLRTLDETKFLEALETLPPLADETDSVWDSELYWFEVAYRFVAIADEAASRRLRPAAPMLLDRACFGDPGEIMRGLRHQLEAIFNPDWGALAAIAIEKAQSPRSGTRLWAIDQLAVLDDPLARRSFETALADQQSIAAVAQVGLRRLDRLTT